MMTSALPHVPAVFGIFAVMLAGIAVFHRRTLLVALAGLAAIIVVRAYGDGLGLGGVFGELGREWVTLANLLLLLLGFEILSNHFEASNAPDHLPNLLPDDWTGGLALLAMVFVVSAFLDNIAAAVIGGVVARHVFEGRVSLAFLAGIVGAANAGGAGSVIGDTTTTLMWLHGVSPGAVLAAYGASVPAFIVFAIAAARAQQRHQPIRAKDEPGHPMRWRRLLVVAAVLAAAVAANIAANRIPGAEEIAPWLGLAIWAVILLAAPFETPDWRLLKPAAKGALFLMALVAAASLMPVAALPPPSPGSTFGLGVLSAVFDNIPLTTLALKQGGYDWALLAFSVGFGGSMVWFGSSAGVALTTLYPEGRSVFSWLKQAWFVPVAYAVGFLVLAGLQHLFRTA